MNSDWEDQIAQLSAWIARAQSILFITGAGISADSGLPTYRGIGGLYDSRETPDGVSIEEALSGPMFRRRPQITWKYLAEIANSCRGKTFNRAHEVIARLEDRVERVCVLTQNIDGFHRAAGSRNVIEIHGSMESLICTGCAAESRADWALLETLPPRCADCDQIIRPQVVLFGEMLPTAAVEQLESELTEGFELVVSIGTSSVFPYIIQPVVDAVRRGIPTVEINPAAATDISSRVNLHIAERAAVALDHVARHLRIQ